jgi:hypothetical protein
MYGQWTMDDIRYTESNKYLGTNPNQCHSMSMDMDMYTSYFMIHP